MPDLVEVVGKGPSVRGLRVGIVGLQQNRFRILIRVVVQGEKVAVAGKLHDLV